MSLNSETEKENNIKLEKLYDEYFERVYKFFYYKILSKEAAEDLTSETFLTFADIIKTNKEIDNLRNFLFGIAKNIFLKYLKLKYKQEIPFTNLGEDFYEYANNFVEIKENSHNLEDELLKYMDKIPEKQAIILKLRLIEKLNLQEICGKINKDMNYVKTTQKRGIKSLKDIIAMYT